MFGTEIYRLAACQIVTDDPELANAVMEPVETRRLELTQPARYHPAPAPDARLEAVVEMDVEAIGQECVAPETVPVLDQLIELESAPPRNRRQSRRRR